MINGQAIKQNFFIIRTDSDINNLDLIPKQIECCFELPALAEYSPTSKYKNDRHSVIWFFGELFPDAKIYIQQRIDGNYVDTEITDNTYGALSPFGFYTNKYSEKAIGYQIEWSKVLNAKGPGIYRFKSEATSSIGISVTYYSFEFQLMTYTTGRANGSVLASWNRKGILGSKSDDKKVEDYGDLNWFNQIRIPHSIFGFETSAYERSFVKYRNGNEIWLQDNQIEEFTWKIIAMPEPVHRFLKVDMMQSGKITLTDYNDKNPTRQIDKEVIPASDYVPEWVERSMYANATLKFNSYTQNFTHLNE